MDALVDVGIIFTYERDFLVPLLKSLPRACGNTPSRLILIDNNSGADMAEFTAMAHPVPVKVVKNPSRLNYSKNLNVILNHSDSQYVLLMNTDMLFVEGDPCLEKMVRFMESHADCGLSCCRLIGNEGQFMWPARRYQNLGTVLSRRLPFFFKSEKRVTEYLYQHMDQKDRFDCDWVSGCFMMVRRKAFEQIGPVDEKFQKYFEDVDYCARMWAAGWKVIYNGETTCVHLEQRASKNLFSKDAFHHLKSYFYFLSKWGFRKLKGPE